MLSYYNTPARGTYCHYECDKCKQPIGYDGSVRVKNREDGLPVVWAAICPDCAVRS